MHAYLPCPVELLPPVSHPKHHYGHDCVYGMDNPGSYDGFWVHTQDPDIIANSPGAVTGVTMKQASEALEVKLGTPPNFTLIGTPATMSNRALSKPGDGYYNRDEKSNATLQAHRARLRSFIVKTEGGCVGEYQGSWELYPILPQPKGNPGLKDWEYMAEAKIRGSDGIFVPEEAFLMPNNVSVEPVGTGFLVLRTVLGRKLIYNPKRHKALVTRRTGVKSGRGGYVHCLTAYDCVNGLACDVSHEIFHGKCSLCSVASVNWSNRGISSCEDALISLWEVANRLRITSKLRKKLAHTIRSAHWHRTRYSSSMCRWLDEQLSHLGGPPKESSKRAYQKLRTVPPNPMASIA